MLTSLLQQSLPWASQQATAKLAPLFSRTVAGAGEIVLAEGQLYEKAYLIEKGCLRLYFTRYDGREFSKNFYTAGVLVLPVTEQMWSEPSLFGIQSANESILWRADAAKVRAALDNVGEWGTIQQKLTEHMITAKLTREHELLALTATERYQRFLEQFPGLAEEIPLVQIATYLGITDVSLSRIRRNLRID